MLLSNAESNKHEGQIISAYTLYMQVGKSFTLMVIHKSNIYPNGLCLIINKFGYTVFILNKNYIISVN